MILAVSRFRVANGMSDAVVAAFAARPRLVDGWPGFLGLETFTDIVDSTVFHLVTRWTNRDAYQAWHSSANHRESHRWIPKGLRLDPSHTQVLELERIPGQGALDVATVAGDSVAAFGAYLEKTPVVHVLRCALNGDIQMMNSAMSSHLGLTGASPGASVFGLLTDADDATVREHLSAQVTDAATFHLNFCDARGEPFTLLSHLMKYPDGCLLIGEPVYADEQQLQKQLVELNQELAALARTRHRSVVSEQRARQLAEADNRDKDDGLAVIAHELRQPLNTAMLALAMAKSHPAQAERALEMIDRQVGHMARLIEDLLHASQVTRGAVVLNQEPADLAQLVRDVAEAFGPGVQERQQLLTIVDLGEALLVSMDSDRIRQVLVNILSNAMKYTPHAGVIAVSIQRAATGYRVVVRDSGEGMSADAIGRVFDMFVRGTTGGNGLGIGLAVAKRLVELHGGTLTAHSEGVGRGSEFVMFLPGSPPEQPPSPLRRTRTA